MSVTSAPVKHLTPRTTPQHRHRTAIELHEKAIRHHEEAAALYLCGELRRAQSQAQLAYGHAISALEAGALALQT